jgi:hypothetical protein
MRSAAQLARILLRDRAMKRTRALGLVVGSVAIAKALSLAAIDCDGREPLAPYSAVPASALSVEASELELGERLLREPSALPPDALAPLARLTEGGLRQPVPRSRVQGRHGARAATGPLVASGLLLLALCARRALTPT